MRILHFVHQYAPEHVGGTELYTQTLARYQVNEGHSVAVFSPTSARTSDRELVAKSEEGVRVYSVPTGPRSRPKVFQDTFFSGRLSRDVAVVLGREKPDIVHIQHLMGLPIGLVGQLMTAGIPYVVTLHDYWYKCANAQLITNYDGTICDGPDRWFANCGRCALTRAGNDRLKPLALLVAPLMAYRNRRLQGILGQAHRVIAPTHFVKQVYEDLGIAMDNVVVLPHGIDVPHEQIAHLAKRQRPPKSLHIGYVGSLGRQKGVHNLISAVNRLPYEGVKLSIYGSLDTFPGYVSELKRLAQHPGINFAGRVSRQGLWGTLAEFDVVALPTLWYEASPLTIQEAFAVGVPLVASRIGAMPEKIRDGVDGLLVEPGDVDGLCDALRRLLTDPGLLERLRAGIRPVYTMAQQVKDIDELYSQRP